ncbi:hypothetical protein [Enterobacter cloacae]|uniref:hypothetical protein n=1 Tax=Enterobacter cloacae TaxID=550 RepID=UPI0020752E8F|nr:hypothetical protein [Enterobacter cloacae]MCM7134493.1 hypothetical protein [Enterobacter cloacae]
MSNIDKQTLADDESVKTYYIHPAAFGSTKNPGYGHVPVVHADDFEKLRAKLEAAEKRIADQCGIIKSARKFINEYAGLGDVGAAEFIKIIDRAAAAKGE